MLADNEIDLHLSRLAIWHTAWMLDQHEKARDETSMTKVFCSEALGRVVDRCLQILGSIGITRDTVVERIYRDIRPFRIYDGPSEVHRHVPKDGLLAGLLRDEAQRDAFVRLDADRQDVRGDAAVLRPEEGVGNRVEHDRDFGHAASEALAEHAQWVILHRERPFEFVSGGS